MTRGPALNFPSEGLERKNKFSVFSVRFSEKLKGTLKPYRKLNTENFFIFASPVVVFWHPENSPTRTKHQNQ